MVCYKYKDGTFLKSLYMGDGDYELTLSNELTTDCVFETYWGLSYIIKIKNKLWMKILD